MRYNVAWNRQEIDEDKLWTKNRARCSNVSHPSNGLRFDRNWFIFLPHQTKVIGDFEMLRSFLNLSSCCLVKWAQISSIYIGFTRLEGFQVKFYSYFPRRWKSDGIHDDLVGIDLFPIFCRPLQDPYSRSSPGTAPETIVTKRAARVMFFFIPLNVFLGWKATWFSEPRPKGKRKEGGTNKPYQNPEAYSWHIWLSPVVVFICGFAFSSERIWCSF